MQELGLYSGDIDEIANRLDEVENLKFRGSKNFAEKFNLDDEDKHDRYELVNWRDELYYDKNGFAPQFETCADAWEYIFQNNLIK